MSTDVLIVWKNIGETPLECLNRVKIRDPKLSSLPMTYAGRLDPMAEGLMIVLTGDECKNKDKYLKLNKTYEFQILVGFSTDTYDLLGLVASSVDKISGLRGKSPDAEILPTDFALRGQTISKASFGYAFKSFIGTFIQKYPSFSSKTVNGKQLFQLSKDDELPEKLPEHEVTIYNLKCTKEETISRGYLEKEILSRITLVKGDFRQEEVAKKWKEAFEKSNQTQYTIFSCVAECSSGTYIRQLVADLGKKADMPFVTYSIRRTKIGRYENGC